MEASRAELRDRHARIERDRRRELGALDPDFSEQAAQTENDQVLEGLERSVDQDLQQIEPALVLTVFLALGAWRLAKQKGADAPPRGDRD